MKYMEIINRSLQNAWKYKFLWFFGFFVGLTGGGSNGGSRYEVDRHDFFNRIDPVVIVLIILGAITLFLILWLMRTLSEGALIHGVSKKETNRKTDFSDCFKAGVKWFPRLLGIMLLIVLAIIIFVLLAAVFIIPAFLTYKGLGIALLILFLPVFLIFLFVILSVEAWAVRFAVLQDKKWDESLREAWFLLKNQTGKTIGVAFSSVLTKIVFVIILVVAMLFLALPFILVGTLSLGLALIPGIFFGLVILVIFTAFLGTFGSSVWTIGFLELTGPKTPKKTASTKPAKA